MPKKKPKNCLWLVRNQSDWYKVYAGETPPIWDEPTANWRAASSVLLSYITADDWHHLDKQFHLPPGGGPLWLEMKVCDA